MLLLNKIPNQEYTSSSLLTKKVMPSENRSDDMKAHKMFEFKEQNSYEPTVAHELIQKYLEDSKTAKKYSVMIPGGIFPTLFANEFTQPDLAKLLLGSESVVVYRCSPGLKADIVKFIRKHVGKKVTVAIGDGANDVNMI